MSKNLEAFLQSTAELESNTVLPRLKDLLRAVVIETFDQELKPVVQDLFRTVVQEVLESKLSVVQRNPEESNPRILKLKFLGNISSPVYTGVEIEGEGGCPLSVALVDNITEKIVEIGSNNASLEVEIVVLKEEFGANSWTAKEFADSIVSERETIPSNSLGRKASYLLTERVVVKLDNKGVGVVHNVKFKHTSIHMKNTKYRLGARVTHPFRATRIQEAMTEPFLVKDQRILRNMKHYIPSLSDDVWRLEKIDRKGPIYSRLRAKKVNTVEDFLILHLTDPMLLKSTLCMKPSDFDQTLNNAKRCISNKVYCHTDSHQHTGVVFNIFGHDLGQILQSQYVPVDKLSQDAKANAHKLLASAFEHWEEVESFDDQTSLVQKFPKLSSSTSFSNSAGIEMIEELYQQNVAVHINDDGACSNANLFGSTTTCPRNIDELMLVLERQANELSQATDFSSNEFHDGKEKVWKSWKILVNVAKWCSIITKRRGVAILEVHVQKKHRHS